MNQSPFLAEYLFQAASLEVTIYALIGRRLYFYDSAVLWIDELDELTGRLRPMQLRSLLPEDVDNTVSFLAVKNTDLGPSALRSRSLSARSLERAGVFMGEHMNVVTRAGGWADGTRRAVGFSRSRVRDGAGTELTATEFRDWCAEIDGLLKAKRPGSQILSRFAAPTDAPADTTPINILVDMLELTGQFNSPTTQVDAKFDPDGLCVDIEADAGPTAPEPFRFALKVDGADVKVWIKWDAKKRKYWLTSPALSHVKSKSEAKVSLAKRLNQLQPFRIITADLQHAYVNGAFYALDLDLAKPDGPDPTADFLKCQIKSFEGAATKRPVRLKNDFWKYACECKIPVVLVLVESVASQSWFWWLQGCIEANRLRPSIYGSRGSTTIAADWLAPLDEAGNAELKSIARGIHPTARAMHVRDLVRFALETHDHDLVGAANRLLSRYQREISYFPIDLVLDEVLSLGNRIWATLEGNALAELFYMLAAVLRQTVQSRTDWEARPAWRRLRWSKDCCLGQADQQRVMRPAELIV